MIRAIFFDFDGTLSNRQMNAYMIFHDYFRKYVPDLSDMEYEAMLQDMLTVDCNGTIPVTYRLAPFFAKYKNIFPQDFEEKFTTYFYDYMWKYTVLKEETIEVLEKLQGKYKLAIISNGDSKSQHSKITHVDIEKYFDEVIVSGDIGIHKPDKRIFEYMMNKLDVRPEECLMIGDVFSNDILGAYNAGIKPVWIIADTERPSRYYDGYRIENLRQLFDILNKENA